ncbi:endonuclease III domain-containing protein [Desulfocicer niacini]
MHIRDMDQLMDILTKVYASWPAPAITVAAQDGADPFCILVATLISLRTRDAVTGQACQRLFPKAASPGQMIALGSRNIAALIHPASFSPTKGKRLVAISHILLEKYHSRVPDTMEALLALPGVGRKTANLVLVEAFGKPGLCVDTHVHRISNRLGLTSTRTPDQTEMALRKEMPKKYWKAYSEILAVFGQKICRPRSPLCHECPISPLCDGCTPGIEHGE